ALINDPDFLILDEPTTGLDPIGTRQVKELIIELGRRGKTVLLSSHLLADVEDCVDRLVILYGGQKRAEGTCDELLVSQDRTTIETDSLDEATVAEVDRVIRARSSGERAILKVAKPRQSLEALFLDIVERAKAEQVSTSGATSGGETASFLKGETKQGDALIEDLLKAPEPAVVASAAAPVATSPTQAPVTPAGADHSVIGDLLSAPAPLPTKPFTPARGPSVPAPKPAVDDSVIGSLLDLPKSDKPDGGTP
ncbi:MAG: ABC transporter ATP-binding protein, partial [bacterium]|nr:ABC transporter ATP-binding protein [bacterium]